MAIISDIADSINGMATPKPLKLMVRLSIMMLLEFFVFGAWFATMGLILAHHGLAASIGTAYFLSAIAAIVSPLFLGALGDRYTAPRNVLALSHLAGGCLMLALPHAVDAGQALLSLLLILTYMLAFQPTLGYINSIALQLLGQHQHLFPYVRVFAPLGWVVSGVVVGLAGLSASTGAFYLAAASSLVLGLYALTLPRTKPPAAGMHFSLGDLIGINAFVLFRQRSFNILMLCILLTSISLGFYNTYASPFLSAVGVRNVAGVMALGQTSEVLFIPTIPWILRRIGMKWALLLGMATWGLRFALFALSVHRDAGFAVAGVALHGICNDYFIVIGAMFLARISPPELAAQAQGWLTLVISGFGAAIGSLLSEQIYAAYVLHTALADTTAWQTLWLVPIGIVIVTVLIGTSLFPRSSPGLTVPAADSH
jgi:nucleoside transporter